MAKDKDKSKPPAPIETDDPTHPMAATPPEGTTDAAPIETGAPPETEPKAKAEHVTFRISGSVRKAIEGATTLAELHEAVADLRPAERGSIEGMIYAARRRIVRAGGQ